MPHRVANFLRNSTENFSVSAIANLKTKTKQHQQHHQPRHNNVQDEGLLRRVPLDRHSSYSSDDGEHIPYHNMFAADPADHLKEKKHHHHRLSLPFGRSNKDSHENSHAGLDLKIESPPIVFFGDAESSTGALVSGQMQLEVKDEQLQIETFGAKLNIHVQQKRPFTNHCGECTNQYTELKRWTFLTHPTTLKKGIHQFPFSILLEGHLPASMDTPITSIAYEFKAEAILVKGTPGSQTPIKFEQNFDVKRSLPQPEFPHHSVRVFPPTNIKASAHYNQVIHPAGTHNVSFRLDGLTSANATNKTVEFWKLKKVTWKLEETIKTVAPACEKHAPVPGNANNNTQPQQKGVARTETRVLGEKYMHDGWKSDYTSTDGHVEFEFDYGVVASKHSHGPRYACDMKSSDGTEVSHALMIEMVVSKEWAPVGKPHLATQTGTGRILRMHYHVMLTECPGLGVSWDNEAPPVYQDVPPSPPAYPDEAAPVDYMSLEHLDGQAHNGLAHSREGSVTGGSTTS
ncbi:LMBR1 domain-containing protein [Colletotrichum scovillei]|uniref:LMBR1 domain-containing protein n=1 Tax=Colletotrichum scovillei TaxID=1209932 RepID=A0A9P7U5W0_9PEZI|nr:LMBR1 domain-containing protein [Colletotrichum scovillei]KAF4774736.1 LMBR1 domain-containing protein [Colletotrichum scovillei]KAG7038341.1 LMBR1 domain-containing protein [Colletotrichum scovillei]KAG7040663.1 LMBR1 domain-containing protein [Colletotrichum scovillei]KAG7060710.1 LMBR1 domain-containing protein [Colletotrichum scovillei]